MPVYPIIRTMGCACVSSDKQELATKRWVSASPRMGLRTPKNHLWAPKCPFPPAVWPTRAQTERNLPRTGPARHHHQSAPKRAATRTKIPEILKRRGSVAPWKGLGTVENHLGGPLSPGSASFSPGLRLCGPKWGHSCPDRSKTAQDHQKNRARQPSDWRRRLCPSFAPKWCPLAHFGPGLHLKLED